ncbi:MAG: hypothetical protein AVDCRST_MAG31-1900, partial [uncultured Sphingomonas sp.]
DRSQEEGRLRPSPQARCRRQQEGARQGRKQQPHGRQAELRARRAQV